MAAQGGAENSPLGIEAGSTAAPVVHLLGEKGNASAPSPFIEVEVAMREHPGRFNFFQAVRLLLRMLPQRKMIGDFSDPRREVVRFEVHNTLAFPPSDIYALDLNPDLPRMEVNFMGLTGPAGVLPYAYSELVFTRNREKDRTMAAFFDIFNHRMISLFYRAWEKYRSGFVYERDGRDRLSQYLMCLIGLGTPDLQGRLALRDEALLFYTGLLSLAPHSATGLEHILGDYFGATCQVEQFVGAWQPLAASDQCEFDEAESLSEELGTGTVVGDAIWDLQSRIRVKLGPLSLRQYVAFLPDGAAHRPLRELTRFYCGTSLEIEVQLVLQKLEVPRCELRDPDPETPRLGWTSWIKSGSFFDRSPEDTILLLT